MNELSAPIVQQPRLMLILPIGFIVAAIAAANLVWFLARAAAAPRVVGGIGAVLCLVAGIGLAISSSLGSQGTVRAGGGTLEVDPRWRSARRLDLAAATIRPMIWRRGGVTMLLVGVLVEIDDGTNRITIGSSDPALAAEYEEQGAETTTIPPSVTIAPTDFRRLDALLPAARRAGSD